ncbi:hypothetical protein F4818DRAFT_440581 [Hypoxylon cercidicola]|nr:hypothetical protein F4818DRAFT_440581 [Hypoxylon cercidicola]
MKTAAIISATVALFTTLTAAASCGHCTHNNDAGRWADSEKPADVIHRICQEGGTCERSRGNAKLCAVGDTSECICAEEMAGEWQSKYGGDYWLWSSITCGELVISMSRDV